MGAEGTELTTVHSFFSCLRCLRPTGIFRYREVVSVRIGGARGGIVGCLAARNVELLLGRPSRGA